MDQQTDVVPSQRAPLDNSVYLIAALAVFVHFLFNSKYGYFATNFITRRAASTLPGAM